MEKPALLYQVPREPVWHNAPTPATLPEQTHIPHLPSARPVCAARANIWVIDCLRAYRLWFTYPCGEGTNHLVVEGQMILCFVFLPQLVASIVFISFGVIAAFCCAIVDGVFAARHIVSAPRKTQVLQCFYCKKTSDGVCNPVSSSPVNIYHVLNECCFKSQALEKPYH